MADSDYTVIKPVESLQTIQGVTPAKRREERKRRQNAPHDQHEETEADVERDEAQDPRTVRDDDDPHSIDYCA